MRTLISLLFQVPCRSAEKQRTRAFQRSFQILSPTTPSCRGFRKTLGTSAPPFTTARPIRFPRNRLRSELEENLLPTAIRPFSPLHSSSTTKSLGRRTRKPTLRKRFSARQFCFQACGQTTCSFRNTGSNTTALAFSPTPRLHCIQQTPRGRIFR